MHFLLELRVIEVEFTEEVLLWNRLKFCCSRDTNNMQMNANLQSQHRLQTIISSNEWP